MEQIAGCGVDVVMNSLAAELFEASFRCMAEGGRFLELRKVDFTTESYWIPMCS